MIPLTGFLDGLETESRRDSLIASVCLFHLVDCSLTVETKMSGKSNEQSRRGGMMIISTTRKDFLKFNDTLAASGGKIWFRSYLGPSRERERERELI